MLGVTILHGDGKQRAGATHQTGDVLREERASATAAPLCEAWCGRRNRSAPPRLARRRAAWRPQAAGMHRCAFVRVRRRAPSREICSQAGRIGLSAEGESPEHTLGCRRRCKDADDVRAPRSTISSRAFSKFPAARWPRKPRHSSSIAAGRAGCNYNFVRCRTPLYYCCDRRG